jgi:hypothetical protein
MKQHTFPSKYLNQTYHLSIGSAHEQSLQLLSSKLTIVQTIKISEEIEEVVSIEYLAEKNCYLALLRLKRLFENEEMKLQLICLSFCITKKSQVRLFPSFIRNLQFPQK